MTYSEREAIFSKEALNGTEAAKNEAKKNSCEDEAPLIRSSRLLHNV